MDQRSDLFKDHNDIGRGLPPIDRITLTAREFAIQQAIDDVMTRDNTTFDFHYAAAVQAMVMTMRRRIFTHKLDVLEVKWPATWWEHFKDRWFPAWALKRWPVQWQHVDVTAYHNYPEVLAPNHQAFLDFAVLRHPVEFPVSD